MALEIKKIIWEQKFDNDHRDSIWYGGPMVTIDLGRYTVSISACGEIRTIINGNYYCDKNNGGCMAEYLREEKIYNDKDLQKAIQKDKIIFENNNWFEIFAWDNETQEQIDFGDAVVDDLDANDDFHWVIEWLEAIID